MFIKEIRLKGFKRFCYGTDFRSLSPGLNVIVGDKAVGKTSMLEAIEFMFNNKYANMNEDQFNKFTSHNNESPYRHIINIWIDFDNSDKTYDLPKKFTISRITNSKTNEYEYYGGYLSKDFSHEKKMSRKEFVESLQKFKMDTFSDISMIKQEVIIQFATTSDKKRLELLLNIVKYEKPEELKQNKSNVMVEKSNRASIEVNQCHDELEEEDLCYEKFGIEDKKLIWIKEKFPQLEKKWKDHLERQKNKNHEYTELKNKLIKFESELTKKIKHFQSLENTEKELTKTVNELKNHKTTLETLILNSKKNNLKREFTVKKINEELTFLHKEIASKEKTIEVMKSELLSITVNVEEIKTKYREELWELDCLRVKLLKYQEPVSSEGEGDKLIHKIMKDWQESFAEEPGYLKRQRASLEGENEAKVELKKKISLIKAKLNSLKTSRDKSLEELKNLHLKIQVLTLSLKLKPTRIEGASKELRLFQNNYEENRKKLILAVKCDVIQNKTVIEAALQSFNQESMNTIDVSTYHGFAIDCFQCPPEIEVAVLAVAGQRLFHFVFDDKNDAKKILQKIDDEHNQNVISLNRLTSINKTLPNLPNVFPLITKITYEPVYEKLMEFLFSDILVCRDVQEALDLSKKNKITCVTPDGHVFLSNGDSVAEICNKNEENPIGIYRLMSKQLEEVKDLEEYKNKLHQHESSLKNVIPKDLERQKELELQKEHDKQREILLKRELNKRKSELQFILLDDEKHKKGKDFVERLSSKVKEFELRLYNNNKEEISVEEYQRHKELKISTVNLFTLWKEEEKKADELNKQIIIQLNALKVNRAKMHDLPNEIQETVNAKEEENDLIENKIEDLEFTMKKLEETSTRQEACRIEIEKLKKEIKEMTGMKNQQKNEAQKLKLDIDKNETVTKGLESEYNEIQKTIEDTLSVSEIQARVYNKFEVINDNLKDIVTKFIPYGHAQLIFMVNDQQYTVNEAKNLDLEGYTGVNIKFSESDDRPAQNMNDLSDEQKNIITLALFLAIQKSNLTPIVLCDEIDQALHSNHRQVLGTIMKEMSLKAQIFFITSHPEILQVGHNFFHVYEDSKNSRKISKQQALDFLALIKSGNKTNFFIMPKYAKVMPVTEKVTELTQLHNEALKKLESQCYSALMNTIADLAKKRKWRPDSIINPIAVREMSQQMPISKKEMSQIRHVRKDVFAKCGNACLKVTTQYVTKKVKLLEKQKKEKEEANNTVYINIEDDSSIYSI